MHYYKRNLGDYAKKAGRLSMLQHGSYTLLIDACYDREQFPTLEDAIEWTWASTKEEIEAVEFVLRKFFVVENGVYVQKRIQEELTEYRTKSKTNKRIAEERETKRKEKLANRTQVVDEPPPNQEPITNNQEPIKTKEKKAAAPPLNFFGADEAVIADFIKQRKTKISQTAIDGIKREADKVAMSMTDALTIACVRGWQSFRADWLQPKSHGSQSYQSATDKAKQWADRATGKVGNGSHQTIIDIN